jgi:hypothetical protein
LRTPSVSSVVSHGEVFDTSTAESTQNIFTMQSDINYAELSSRNCHAGLSGIILQERFPTSGNDNYATIVMTLCLKSF